MTVELHEEMHDALSDIYHAMVDNEFNELYGFTKEEVDDALDTLEVGSKALTKTQLGVYLRALETRILHLKETLMGTVGLSEEDKDYFSFEIGVSEGFYLELQRYIKSL
jgi:hypothetical protein